MSYASSELKPRVHCTNEQKRDLLITKLEENNIPYRIENLGPDKREYVIWKKSDDERARTIIRTFLNCSCGDPAKESTTMASDKQNDYLAILLKKNGIEFKVIDNPFVGGPKNAIEYNLVDKDKIRPFMIQTLKEIPYTKYST
jgi:hypothetical protein